LKSWPSEILQSQKQGLHTASQSESIFTERLEKEKVEFVKECTELAERLEVILMFDNYKMVKENSAVVISLRDRIERAQECVRSFNHREGLFRLNSSEWDEFQRICETFEPYHKLWELCMEFELDRSDW
jgi:dynein heavy chain